MHFTDAHRRHQGPKEYAKRRNSFILSLLKDTETWVVNVFVNCLISFLRVFKEVKTFLYTSIPSPNSPNRFVILTKFASQDVQDVVNVTTSGTAIDENLTDI